MKPYGFTGLGKTKQWDWGFEDVLAIVIGGRKSCIGKFPEKCGAYKSYTRSTSQRSYFRRYWKKSFRNQLKQDLIKILKEETNV